MISIQEDLDEYRDEDNVYNKSQLVNSLVYEIINTEDDYLAESRGIEDKVKVLSKLVIRLYVDKWESEELSDEELKSRLNIIL